MIPTTATPSQQAAYVDNIIRTYESATQKQIEAGRAWYPSAHRIATVIAHGDTRRGAGVLAALSPQKAWPRNVQLAESCISDEKARGHVRDACSKAEQIMAGADPAEVLPSGLKTWHFFVCIAHPDSFTSVVIDRHAHDVAVGKIYGNRSRGLSNRARYATLADVYRIAGSVLHELPSTVQAVTWLAHRARISGTSTRGGLT